METKKIENMKKKWLKYERMECYTLNHRNKKKSMLIQCQICEQLMNQCSDIENNNNGCKCVMCEKIISQNNHTYFICKHGNEKNTFHILCNDCANITHQSQVL